MIGGDDGNDWILGQHGNDMLNGHKGDDSLIGWTPRHIEQGELIPLLTDHVFPPVTIHVVYPQTRHLSARARAFIDYVRSHIGAEPIWENCLRS